MIHHTQDTPITEWWKTCKHVFEKIPANIGSTDVPVVVVVATNHQDEIHQSVAVPADDKSLRVHFDELRKLEWASRAVIVAEGPSTYNVNLQKPDMIDRAIKSICGE